MASEGKGAPLRTTWLGNGKNQSIYRSLFVGDQNQDLRLAMEEWYFGKVAAGDGEVAAGYQIARRGRRPKRRVVEAGEASEGAVVVPDGDSGEGWSSLRRARRPKRRVVEAGEVLEPAPIFEDVPGGWSSVRPWGRPKRRVVEAGEVLETPAAPGADDVLDGWTSRRRVTKKRRRVVSGSESKVSPVCSGPRSPASVVSVFDPGFIAWVNPEQADVSDDLHARFISTLFGFDEVSEPLRATNYGFAIPAGSVISGITVAIERHEDQSEIRDYELRIVKGGVPGGDDKAVVAEWPLTDTVKTYGGSDQLWGLSWSVADINATDFGVQLRATNIMGNGEIGSVDAISITVCYFPPAQADDPPEVGFRPSRGARRWRRRFLAGEEVGAGVAPVPIAFPRLWPVEGDGITETYGYKTDVLSAYDGTEQRVRLRGTPEEVLRFGFVTGSARESEVAASLVFGIQDEVVAVPFWQYGSRITVAVSPGDMVISFADAMDGRYLEGEFAALWVDAFTWEIVKVNGVSGAGLTLVAAAVVAWPVGTMVYPARRARMVDRVGVGWDSTRFLNGVVEFRMERQ